jgi:hypothetical protein
VSRWRSAARIALAVLCIAAMALAVPWSRHRLVQWEEILVKGKRTVDDRVADFREPVAERLRPAFATAGLTYPPARIALLAFKDERVLRLCASGSESAPWRWIADYPIVAASGKSGPKLREGDWQVPEGVYPIESLNPNSKYHLALRVGYPNDDDRARARADGRTQLGGDIMIHGSNASVGCLAMGDQAAEDLFVLAALVGIERVRVVIAPTDLRLRPAPMVNDPPSWLGERYADLAKALAEFPGGPRGGSP